MPNVPIIGDITGASQRAASTRAADVQGAAAMRSQELIRPYARGGQQGLNALLYGLGLGGDAGESGIGAGEFMGPITMESLEFDPAFDFRREQGNLAIERGAGRGRSPYGSAAVNALTRYNQELASQEYGNAFQRAVGERGFRYGSLMNMANLGMGAATGQANYGMMGANATAAGIMGGANARAQGTQNMLQLGLMGAGMYYGPWGAAAGGAAGDAMSNPVGGAGYDYHGGPR